MKNDRAHNVKTDRLPWGILLLGLLFCLFFFGLFAVPTPAQTPAQQQTQTVPKPAIYCGAMTKAGHPCRRRVKAAGLHCFMHQTAK